MQKAKITNGKLEIFQRPSHILGNTDKYAEEQGYKDLIIRNGDGGLYETETNIINEIPIPVVVEPVLTNDDIRALRQEHYKLRSDSLYLACQKYTALGEIEKAEESRVAWLAEIELIDLEHPYITE